MARTFRSVAPGTGPTSTISQFWGFPSAWAREGWGMPVGVGSGWRELSIQLPRTGPNVTIRQFGGVPPAWGREGWGMPVGVGSG